MEGDMEDLRCTKRNHMFSCQSNSVTVAYDMSTVMESEIGIGILPYQAYLRLKLAKVSLIRSISAKGISHTVTISRCGTFLDEKMANKRKETYNRRP